MNLSAWWNETRRQETSTITMRHQHENQSMYPRSFVLMCHAMLKRLRWILMNASKRSSFQMRPSKYRLLAMMRSRQWSSCTPMSILYLCVIVNSRGRSSEDTNNSLSYMRHTRFSRPNSTLRVSPFLRIWPKTLIQVLFLQVQGKASSSQQHIYDLFFLFSCLVQILSRVIILS